MCERNLWAKIQRLTQGIHFCHELSRSVKNALDNKFVFFSSSLHLVKTGVIIEAGDGDFELKFELNQS